MPLRPVSELGLVDLTDLASREDDGTATRVVKTPKDAPSTRAARNKSASKPKKSASKPKSMSGKPKVAGATAPQAAKRSNNGLRTQPVSHSDQSRGDIRRSRAAKVGIPVLTGAIAVAGGFLLGQTALRPR